MTEVIYAKLKSLDDIVRLVSLSPAPFIEYVNWGGRNVYFVHTLTLLGPPMVYYVERADRVKEKYVVFNRYKDEVSFSNQLGTDPQSVYIPILELEKTNIFEKLSL